MLLSQILQSKQSPHDALAWSQCLGSTIPSTLNKKRAEGHGPDLSVVSAVLCFGDVRGDFGPGDVNREFSPTPCFLSVL
jgi:hypothetical protein